jgi:hypothetical protein
MNAILWRFYWTLQDLNTFIADALFPIVFIISAMGCGFGLGYMYRFLFAEPGNFELLLTKESKEVSDFEEHVHS